MPSEGTVVSPVVRTGVVADPHYTAAHVAASWGIRPPMTWHEIEPHDPETWKGVNFEGWTVYWYQEDHSHPPVPLSREAAGRFHRFLRETSRSWPVD